MRHIIRQLNDIMELWSQKHALCGAVVELPEIYKNLEKYDHLFTDREHESLHRISNRKRKASRIAGRIAVRYALRRLDSRKFSDPPSTIVEILNDKNGKPYLTMNTDICISISHSGGCAIAVASKKKVGIDIERIEKRPECFLKAYFCASEQNWIRDDRSDIDSRVNYLWTRKEAVSKLLGVGGTIPFRSIPVLESESDFIFDSHQIEKYCVSLALQKEVTT